MKYNQIIIYINIFRRNIYLKQTFNFRWRWFEFGVKSFWIIPFQSCCSVWKYWNHTQQPRMDRLPRAPNPLPKLFCTYAYIVCYILIHILCCIFLYGPTCCDYLYGRLQPDLCPLPSGKMNKGHSMSPDGLFILIRIVKMRAIRP